MIRSNLYRLLAFFLLVTFSYTQGVQLLHGYYHHHSAFQKNPHIGKDPACKICDHLLAKKHQQLTGEIYTLRIWQTKPVIIFAAACPPAMVITLPNNFNKGPPAPFSI